jgi:hypothetical protein
MGRCIIALGPLRLQRVGSCRVSDRHGVDLKEGLALGIDEARLYCNLIRSYLMFLIAEHERVSRGVA